MKDRFYYGRIARTVMVLSLAVAFTSGCQLRAIIDVRIERDGSGQLELSLGADEELIRRAAEAGADPLGQLAHSARDLRANGWTITEADEPGSGREVVLSKDFDSAAELTQITAELAAALAGPEIAPLEPLVLTVRSDQLELRGAAGLELTDAVEDLGLTADEALELLRADDAVDYRIQATFPGAVVDSNASEQSERQLVWQVPIGERVELTAVGERPAMLWRLVAGGLAGLAVGAAVLALVVRRLRSRAMVVQRYRR